MVFLPQNLEFSSLKSWKLIQVTEASPRTSFAQNQSPTASIHPAQPRT